MKNLYLLITALFFLVCSCEKHSQPVPPKHKGYIFQHQTVVPKVEGEGCHSGYIEKLFSWMDEGRDRRLSRYNINSEEVQETSQAIEQQVARVFEHVPGREQEQLDGILDRMRPYLPEEYQNFEVYFVRHRVVGDRYVNAFTFSGNKLFVSSGLWEATDNLDQIAYILGHEIGHHTNDHCLEMHRTKQRWIERLAFFGIESKGKAEVATILEEVISKGLGQEDELEADLTGMYLCMKAGYDPLLGSALFQKFASFHNPNRSLWKRMWSTHPAPENRQACMEGYLAIARDSANALYAREMIAYDQDFAKWERSQWMNLSLPKEHFPIVGLTIGVVLFILGRRRHAKPLVSLIGVVLSVGSLAYIAVEHFNNHSDFLPVFERQLDWNTDCEYSEDGCNGVYANATVTTESDRLNVRATPFDDATIIEKLDQGETVRCHYCSRPDNIGSDGGRWCRISTSKNEGWVWGDYLIVNSK